MKRMLLACIMALTFSQAVMANPASSGDMDFAFKNHDVAKSADIQKLSEQEMKDTKGDYYVYTVRYWWYYWRIRYYY